MTQPDPATAGAQSGEMEVGSVFVSNYPPYSAWGESQVDAVRRALEEAPRPDADFGLYLHIPFCRKRCKFCYFRVYTDKNFDEIGSYLDALGREVELYAEKPAIRGRKPKFVYFGGGTPSYISVRHLEDLVARLRAAISWDDVEEVTFECEPGTLTRAKLEAVRRIGVTRLSLGIESFDDEILRANGRAHVSKEILRCLPWIADIGFDQVNVDLIAGMVGETWESWRESVRKTIEADPDSVTIYQLELPFNTRFSRRLKDGELERPLADWSQKREWHDYAFSELAAAGYEGSSAYTMVKSGRGCRFVYRDSVWRGCDLLGTGVASFSHLSGVHFQNVDGWGEYLARLREERLAVGRALRTNVEERLTRELILQLKTGEIGGEYFRRKFGAEIFERFETAFRALEERGMIELAPDAARLTRTGLLRVDMLLPEFYAEAYRNARYT